MEKFHMMIMILIMQIVCPSWATPIAEAEAQAEAEADPDVSIQIHQLVGAGASGHAVENPLETIEEEEEGNSVKKTLKTMMEKLNKINKELVLLTQANSEITDELGAMENNLAQGNSEIEIQLGSMANNLTLANLDITDELGSMDNNLIEIQSQNTYIEKLIVDNIGRPNCSEESGFFKSGDQCFKLFPESLGTWQAANEFCIDHGLKLAKTDNPATAVAVRRFLLEKYGDEKYCWIGAHGTGSTFVWISDGSTLSSTSSAWWPGSPSSTLSSQCVILLVRQGSVSQAPSQPINNNNCAAERLPLCELE